MSKPSTTAPKERRKEPLCGCIRASMERYFHDLDGHNPTNIYHMVLKEVEKPLLEEVLRYTRGNQTKAAEVLGINRSTLRKKLDLYGLS
ncbi:MAG: Fis family transcriptional regulator factor for inversion stimulation protein [Halothiobacillaceae bacterium]|nr:MAG: Fis family transcriptional regulator factor for inversion stimulation protein [Halothiobacillaceae bacterium]